MQFTLLQHGENINHNHGIDVIIDDTQWQKWYQENSKRMNIKSSRKGYFRTFDVNECQECQVIGIEHLQELLNFISNE